MKTRVVVTVVMDVVHGHDESAAEIATEAVTNAVKHAESQPPPRSHWDSAGFKYYVGHSLGLTVAEVRPGTRYIKVEWHPDNDQVSPALCRRNREENGEDTKFAMIPADCDVEAVFEDETGHPATCIIRYSADDLYDSDGNLLTVEPGEGKPKGRGAGGKKDTVSDGRRP